MCLCASEEIGACDATPQLEGVATMPSHTHKTAPTRGAAEAGHGGDGREVVRRGSRRRGTSGDLVARAGGGLRVGFGRTNHTLNPGDPDDPGDAGDSTRDALAGPAKETMRRPARACPSLAGSHG